MNFLQTAPEKKGISSKAISKYIDECWEKHLEGRLRIEGSDISQFTRRNLTHRMAQLFEELVDHSEKQ